MYASMFGLYILYSSISRINRPKDNSIVSIICSKTSKILTDTLGSECLFHCSYNNLCRLLATSCVQCTSTIIIGAIRYSSIMFDS